MTSRYLKLKYEPEKEHKGNLWGETVLISFHNDLTFWRLIIQEIRSVFDNVDNCPNKRDAAHINACLHTVL